MVFATTFLALVAAGDVATRRIPALRFARQEVPAPTPPNRHWTVVLALGEQIDHTLLWNGLGPSMDNARRAQVLFVGSSQMQLALAPHVLRRFKRRHGIAAFSLALPFGEGWAFPLALIEKFDLRPRMVVANVPGFFTSALETGRARQARTQDFWTAATTVLELRLAQTVWPSASRVLPSFVARRRRRVMFRSTLDGTWLPVDWPSDRELVAKTSYPLKWDLKAAATFRDALAARGTQLVLTCVPSGSISCTPDTFVPLALALGVPVLLPRVEGPLWTCDYVHLCPASAKSFAPALTRELARLLAMDRLRRGVQPR